MKRRVLSMLLALTVVVGAVGCGGGAANNETTSSNADTTASTDVASPEGTGDTVAGDGKVVEIEFLHGQPEEERVKTIDGIIADFEKVNPGIKVKQMPIPEDGFWTKIITLMSTGKLPAVVEGGVDQLRLMNAEEALDLEAITQAIEQIGKDRFYKGALDIAKAPGVDQYLGVPISGWVSGIWYKRSLFEEKGLQPPTTWENILKAAETLNDPDNKNYGIVFATEESDFTEQTFSSFTGSINYQLFNAEGKPEFNNSQMKELLDFYKELNVYNLPGSNGVEQVKDAFVGGHAAMAIYSTYIMQALVEQDLASDIAFAVPEKDAKGSFGMTSTLGISNMISDEQREAAIKFVSFLGEKEENIKWCHMAAGGSNPVLKDVAVDPAYLDNEVLKAFGETAAKIPEAFESLQILGMKDGDMNPAMAAVSSKFLIPHCINSILVQGEDVDKAMDACQKAIEEEVAALE